MLAGEGSMTAITTGGRHATGLSAGVCAQGHLK
jgi:hypothetical protein